ncbi:hypothetical protein FQS15_06435 [Listeria innocua]|uniref:hypothetical protein n=1 Tax=Listeria innocua TaxID=1642 RepID=UPI0014250B51|nr:hypothetical protein [Listeria innocua]EDO1202084.1 hypothetical protein [Listeria innocua]
MAKTNTKSDESTKSEKKNTYKIMTPNPFTFVALDDEEDLWADEKGVITTTDKNIAHWLLSFSNFVDISNI